MRMLSELSCSGASLPSFSHRNSWGLRGGMWSGTAASPPQHLGGWRRGAAATQGSHQGPPPNPNSFHLSVICYLVLWGEEIALCGMWGRADGSPHLSLELRPPAPGRGKQRFGACGWVGRGRWGELGVLTRGCLARHTAAAASLLPLGTAGAVQSSLLVCLEGEQWGERAALSP